MKQLLGTLTLLCALTSMPTLAATEYSGFFIGGGVSNVDLDIKYIDEDFSGTGFTLYGGYNFTQWFGLEAAISAATDLGDSSSDLTAAAFTVTPKFSLVLNDTVTLFAKAGIASVALNDDYYDDGWDSDADFSGIGYTLGTGANFAVTEHLNIRLSYEYISAELDADSNYYSDIDTELSVFNLGLHYQF